MISDEKQYEFITKRVNDLANSTHDGLKLFIPMYSAIVGGTIWLRLQVHSAIPAQFVILSNVLVCLVTFVCVAVTADNLHAWRGYRKKLAELTASSKHPAPLPVFFPSSIIEIILCLAMVMVATAFVLWNPFKTLH